MILTHHLQEAGANSESRPSHINRLFKSIVSELSPTVRTDLLRSRVMDSDGDLTAQGLAYLRELLQEL